MKTILITGATGNAGMKIIKNISRHHGEVNVLAGVKDAKADRELFEGLNVDTVHFDFGDRQSVKHAFSLCNTLFLLRPPQLADVKKYFEPLIETAVQQKIEHLVFLSVQGAETSTLIPHHKIEKLIEQSGIPYTFLRPAYFMQNFTTTLREDLVENNRIYLPAGKAKFTLIDVEDLGLVASEVLISPDKHVNKAYELTNDETLNFGEMAAILSEVLDKDIRFVSPNLVSFYLKKRREKVPPMFILVMIMLHYLPRFKPTPNTSGRVQEIAGTIPKTFREFVMNNQELLKSL